MANEETVTDVTDVDALTPEEQQAAQAMESGEPIESEPKQEKPVEEPKEEPKPAEAAKPPEGFVPHQAMHGARVKRQAAETKLADLETRLAALEKPAEEDPQWADPVVDPEAHRKWQEHQFAKLQKGQEEQQTAAQAQQQEQQQVARVVQAAQEFTAKTPDYPEAFQWAMEQRQAELQAQGFAQHEIAAQIETEIKNNVEAADRLNMNPAELLYLRATQAGYTKKQPAPKEDEKIVALAEAQKQTQNLGSAGGGQQGGSLTAEQLANMSEAELAKVSDEDLARVFGG